MGSSESPVPPLHDHYINPELVAAMGEEALRVGISIADCAVEGEALIRAQEELMDGTRVKKGLVYPHTLAQRAPHTAKLVHEIDRGLAQVIGPNMQFIRLTAQVLYYDSASHKGSLEEYALPPHMDTAFQYLHAALTIYGRANFYYSPAGIHFHMGRADGGNQFSDVPFKQEVTPGTLVVMRATVPNAEEQPMAHAVSHPKGPDGKRIALAISYLSD